MAKRFTDSTKWNDNWFSNLNNQQKLTWIYILDTCDHSGIWEKNLKVLNFHIGSNYVGNDLNEIFSGKFIEINDKWFIPNFIKFQYGDKFLTSTNNAILSARKLLLEIGFLKQDKFGTLTLTSGLGNPQPTLAEPLSNPYEGVQEQEQEQDKRMVQYKYIRYDKVKDEYQFENKTKKQKEEQLNEQEQIQYENELKIYNEKYNK